MRIIKQCRCCGKEFIAAKITSMYCSNACDLTPAENGGYPPTQNGDIRSLF
jgi:hypothetical protein